MDKWGGFTFIRIMVAILFTIQNALETNTLFVTSATLTTSKICTHISGISSKQMRFCEKHPMYMSAIFKGIALGLQECQYQFRKRRWNCTSLISKPPLYKKHAMPGTKEDAFTHAIIAAGIAHSVARTLTSGNLTIPGEHRDTKNSIKIGLKVARQFLEGENSKSPELNLMNEHNNEVGLEVTRINLDIKCQCQGVSGQCSSRVCWKWLPKFRNLAKLLKAIYDDEKSTVEVKPVLRRSVAEKVPSYLVLKNNNKLKPGKKNLVKMQHSPNYCTDVNSSGVHVPGTVGRRCLNDKTVPLKENSCEALCCGRGYNVHEIVRVWDCQCKFYWCCRVKCKRCKEKVIMHSCQ